MSKLLKNKSLVTIVSIVACLLILWFAYSYRVNKVRAKISVPVAKEMLPARTLLTNDNVITISVASALLSNDIIKNKAFLTDSDNPLYVNYNTFIPAGGLFYDSTVVKWSHMPDSAWADIPDDYSVVSLPVLNGAATLYANTIFPGDKIDIYASYNDEDNEGAPLYGPLFTAVTVLAVKDQDGNHIFKKGPDQQKAQALIFALNNTNTNGEGNQFLLFQKALRNMDLIPVPRNKNYTDNTENAIKVGSSTIINYINSIAPEIEATIDNSTANNGTVSGGDAQSLINKLDELNNNINIEE